MRILLYQGKSLISRAIRWQTRSKYSHAAVELDSGQVIEAWRKGVRMTESMSDDHTPGTMVDCFAINAEFDPTQVEDYLLMQIGKKYDFKAIARFLTRRDQRDNEKWFCSELVAAAFNMAEVRLLARIPDSHVSPRDLWISPLLVYQETKQTK